jgi:phage baseplate assembly protein V
MIDHIEKRISRALGGIRQAFRGVMSRVNSAPKVQLIQAVGLRGENIQAAEYFQHYGYTSNPPEGAMFVMVPIGGKTAHGIVIATEHGSYRLKNLAPGEVAIYDDLGQKIHLTRNGIVIDGANKQITITNTPKVRMDIPLLEVTGEIKDKCDTTGKTMSGMRTTYNGHTHNDPQGGAVAAPNQAM